ncbi:MAG: DUF4230 domain-containing protein [Kiritimatiellae bacterium]|nr:DUF4230 domain-containing protein [Kiritimatiellia bacterium]
MRKFLKKLREILRYGIVLLALYAGATLLMELDCVKLWLAQLLSTQSKIACELLENKQIAELATRKIKWKVLTVKESMHESFVMETVYTLKFGFDLSEIASQDIVVDDANRRITITLPSVRLLSIDTFGERKTLVSKKTAFARLASDAAHDPGVDEAAEAHQLMDELKAQHLLDAAELANDFSAALSPIWSHLGTYTLTVTPPNSEIDIETLFKDYRQKK